MAGGDAGPAGATTHRGLDYSFGKWAPPADRPFELAPGIHWLRMPMPGALDHINLWMLDDEDDAGPGTAIVDTGMNLPAGRALWDALLPGRRITRIIGTHMHPDHVGLAGWLSRRTGARLHMSRGEYLLGRTLQLDARPSPPDEALAYVLAAGWPEAAVTAFRGRPWNRYAAGTTPLPGSYHRLEHDDVLRIGGRRWRVMVGRGHSPEHVCLVDEEAKLMISGDQVLPRITPNVSVSVTEPDGDPLGEWQDSLERFMALSSDMFVLPSHGFPFHGLHERLAQIIGGHRERLDRLVDFCCTPRTVHDCLSLLFGARATEETLMLATGEAFAHLRRLQRQGLLVAQRHGTALRFQPA
jgi:glyoxylase-like metal-dependent hydrolase (beta-lactamase superfamily II)